MMYKFCLTLVLFYLAGIDAAENKSTEPLNITVMYETLCPDSIKFITKQLYPTYSSKQLGSFFIPILYPYGNANVSMAKMYTGEGTNITFTCQHGEKECIGNRIHACVLNLSPYTLASKLKFINCTMALTDTWASSYPTEWCAQDAGINITDIISCNTTVKGNEYLKFYGDETKRYNITGVPFVVINQKYDLKISNQSVSNFKSVICDMIPGNDTKSECQGSSGKGSASTMSLTVLPVIAVTFLFSKFYN